MWDGNVLNVLIPLLVFTAFLLQNIVFNLDVDGLAEVHFGYL